jgi:hypothetical protein
MAGTINALYVTFSVTALPAVPVETVQTASTASILALSAPVIFLSATGDLLEVAFLALRVAMHFLFRRLG